MERFSLKEKAIDGNGKTIVEITKKLFRPQEVRYLLGDSSKAKRLLKWKPKKSIDHLIDDMVNYELNIK